MQGDTRTLPRLQEAIYASKALEADDDHALSTSEWGRIGATHPPPRLGTILIKRQRGQQKGSNPREFSCSVPGG